MKTQKIKIPLNRPTITRKDTDFIKKSVGSDLFYGDYVREFENKFAKFIGKKYAVTTNCGTSALHLALLSLNIGEGQEVICPSYTCVSILNAVNYTGAKIKLVDCNFDIKNGNLNISFSDLKKKITNKTKAIIVPYVFGYPAEIDKIVALGIPVIEDATQSIGGLYKGKKLGSYGVISVFSLHHSKMLAVGEGGILLTDSKEIFDKVNFLGDYDHTVISQRLTAPSEYHIQYNYKMSDLSALLGISQLAQIPQFIKRRKEITKIYKKAFKGLAEIPDDPKDHIFWRYTVKTKKDPREIIREALKYGIELGRGGYPLLHHFLKLDGKEFPNTEEAVSSLFVVPLYPSLTNKEIDYIIKVVKKIL